jgi:hypothetical protein
MAENNIPGVLGYASVAAKVTVQAQQSVLTLSTTNRTLAYKTAHRESPLWIDDKSA